MVLSYECSYCTNRAVVRIILTTKDIKFLCPNCYENNKQFIESCVYLIPPKLIPLAKDNNKIDSY